MRARALLPWAIPCAALGAWAAASRAGAVPPWLLPAPGEVLSAAVLYLFGASGEVPFAGRFAGDASASLFRVGAGFALAAVLGLPLGLVSGRLAAANRLLSGTVNALRAVPGITWLPLALAWFGVGFGTTVFLVALAAFFPVYLNAASGARGVNPLLLRAGAMLGEGRLRGTFSILVPAAMPQVRTGLRLGLGVSWAYLVLGELTGVADGLGAAIMDARAAGRLDMIVCGMIVIALMGRATDRLLTGCLRAALKSARRLP